MFAPDSPHIAVVAGEHVYAALARRKVFAIALFARDARGMTL